MRIRCTRAELPYAQVPNDAMRDERVSIAARGMLALLMTYADDWTFRRGHLMDVAGVGKDKFQSIMRELSDAGYVERRPDRDEHGRLVGTQWVIIDDGNRGRENPALGEAATEGGQNRPPAKPAAGKSGPLRRPISKNTNGEEHQGAGEPDLFAGEKPDAGNGAPKPPDLDASFEEAWQLFPEKPNRGSKKNAKAKFRAAIEKKRVALPDIMRAIQLYREQRDEECRAGKSEPRYTKAMEHWLNGECWAGVLEGARPDKESPERRRLREIREGNGIRRWDMGAEM